MNHQYYNKSSAFSLIELMVTIAIIGLLTAIATPIYTSYTIKSNVSSALPILEGLKVKASEHYTANNLFPSSTTFNSDPNYAYSDAIILGARVGDPSSCATITTSGTILGCVQVMFNNIRANYPLNNRILSFIAIDAGTAIQWACKSGNNNGSTIDVNYLPKSCQ